MNQQKVADGANVHRSRVSAWLNGKTEDPARDTILKLVNYFGCSIEWLADNMGEPFPLPETQTAENVSDFQPYKDARDADKTLEKINRVHFKLNCSAYFDEFFDFIAENYGESKEGTDQFFSELMQTHSNYRVWLEEKKQAREDIQTGGSESIAANGK